MMRTLEDLEVVLLLVLKMHLQEMIPVSYDGRTNHEKRVVKGTVRTF